MKRLRSGLGGVLLGIAAALVSSAIVVGSFALALAEGGERVAVLATSTITPTFTASPSPVTPQPTLPPLPPGVPTYTPSPVPSDTPTPTATPPPPPTDCPPPPDWVPHTVVRGDTLRQLAEIYGTTQEALAEGNCLLVSRLQPDSILYVPAPPSTATARPCGPPDNWVIYEVQRGDTLFQLSEDVGVSVPRLQFANCLSGTTIVTGQSLYLPFVPAPPPSPTSEPTEKEIVEPTATEEPSPTSTPTLLPTEEPTSTETSEPRPTPTEAPTAEPTNSPPAISRIGDQRTSEDILAGPLSFTVRDEETRSRDLLVTASSSNPNLVPDSNISMTGSTAERSLTISPVSDQTGSTDITITVTDPAGLTDSVSFSLRVDPVNDPPLATDDAAFTTQDTAITITVLDNDSDVEGEGLSISAVGVPANGSADIAGAGILYTPGTDFSGTDSFEYTVSDASGGTDIATVTVTVE